MLPQISNEIHTSGNCCFKLRDAFERMQNGSKLMSKVGQRSGVARNILSRINPIPLGGGQYVSDIRITPDYRCLYFNIYSRFRPGIKG